MQPSFSFTSVSTGGLLRVLRNECGISAAFDPQQGNPGVAVQQFVAIWDTGATDCVISQRVVDQCGLVATGMAQAHGVHGAREVETYLVNIYLPNTVAFPGVRVTKGEMAGCDILIGMNVINQGDFAITNKGGLTKFSFRMPSIEHIDFVAADHHRQVQQAHFSHGGTKKDRPKRHKTFGKNKKKPS